MVAVGCRRRLWRVVRYGWRPCHILPHFIQEVLSTYGTYDVDLLCEMLSHPKETVKVGECERTWSDA